MSNTQHPWQIKPPSVVTVMYGDAAWDTRIYVDGQAMCATDVLSSHTRLAANPTWQDEINIRLRGAGGVYIRITATRLAAKTIRAWGEPFAAWVIPPPNAEYVALHGGVTGVEVQQPEPCYNTPPTDPPTTVPPTP